MRFVLLFQCNISWTQKVKVYVYLMVFVKGHFEIVQVVQERL